MGNLYPSIEILNEAFELRGREVFWKERPSSHFKTSRGRSVFNSSYSGLRAGTLLAPLNQYRILWLTHLDKKYQILEHVVVWALSKGEYPNCDLDHEDGNGLNNNIRNLIEKSKSENMHNKKMYKNNKSGHVGVTWYKRYGKWCASGRHDGKRKTIGYYEELSDAIAARKEWEEGKGFTERHGK